MQIAKQIALMGAREAVAQTLGFKILSLMESGNGTATVTVSNYQIAVSCDGNRGVAESEASVELSSAAAEESEEPNAE